MIRISLRDLQWRRRRFVIVVIVASLAFGLALVMSGVTNQLSREGRSTVALFHTDQWVVAAGVSGPFTSSQLIDGHLTQVISTDRGALSVSPILIGRTAVGAVDVNIVGYDPNSTNLPAKLAAARARTTEPDGLVADVSLHRSIGDRIRLGSEDLPVVAIVEGTGFFFSAPTVFLPLPVVQRLLFAGQDVISAVLVQGDLDATAVAGLGLAVRTNAQVTADFERVIKSSADTIGMVNLLLWLMAAGIVAAIVYVSVLERSPDFATLKAIGATTSSLFGGLMVQAALISVASAAVSVAVSQGIAPTFSFPVSIALSAYLQLVVIALVVGIAASFVGIRKISRIDPALAFGATS